MNFYVYRLDDPITGDFYFGSRQCECDIIDDTYMGSYSTWKPVDKSRLVKTVLKSNFANRTGALKYEATIITEHYDNSLNQNYIIPGTTQFKPRIHGNKTIKKYKMVQIGESAYNKLKKYCEENDKKLGKTVATLIEEKTKSIVLHNVLQVAPTQTKNRPY